MWGAKDLSGGYGEGGDELSGSDFGQDDGDSPNGDTPVQNTSKRHHRHRGHGRHHGEFGADAPPAAAPIPPGFFGKLSNFFHTVFGDDEIAQANAAVDGGTGGVNDQQGTFNASGVDVQPIASGQTTASTDDTTADTSTTDDATTSDSADTVVETDETITSEIEDVVNPFRWFRHRGPVVGRPAGPRLGGWRGLWNRHVGANPIRIPQPPGRPGWQHMFARHVAAQRAGRPLPPTGGRPAAPRPAAPRPAAPRIHGEGTGDSITSRKTAIKA
jgi:hypothetical protein